MVIALDTDDVMDAVYAAAVDGTSWSAALASVARRFGAAAAALEVYGKASGALLFREHGAFRPHALAAAGGPEGLPSELAVGVAVSYLHAGAVRLTGVLTSNEERLGVITIDGARDANERTELRRLLPHLRRALEVHVNLRARIQREGALSEALERLAFGTVLLDRRGRPLFANAAARRAMAPGAPVELRAFGLHAPADHEQLREQIARALADRPERGEVVLGESPGPTLALVIVPLPHATDGLSLFLDDPPAVPAAVVFVGRDDATAAVSRGRLGRLSKLTAAEAGLVEAILAGRTLSEHAAREGVRLTTARTHLFHARAKLGARSQSDLVRRILARIPPVED